jgi:hypothetical protein
VPYYLVFHPDEQELTLFRHTKRKYVSVKPNEHDRLALPELELEMGLFGGWCRFWYRGELLPLPADLLTELEQTRRERDQEKQRAEQEKQRADAAERELELLRAKLKKMRGK